MKRGDRLALLVMLPVIFLSNALQAENVVLENHGKRTFYYSLRTSDGAAWSQAYQIGCGEKQIHPASARLRISYLSDKAHFEWLDVNKTYRINDVADGRLQAVTQVLRPELPAAAPDADTPATSNPPAATRTGGDAPQLSDPSTATFDSTKATESQAGDSTTGNEAAAPSRSRPSTATSEAARPSEAGDGEVPNARGGSRQPDVAAPASTLPSATVDQNDATFDGLFDITNRVVTVRAITDNTYRTAFPEWRERVRRTIAGASEYYQREYAIRLVVTETSEWDYDAVHDTLKSRWSRLLEKSPQDVDLIIALVGFGDYSSVEGEATFTGQLGRAAFFGQHLMVADRQDYHVNRAKTILIHELGHIFGAFHVADQDLMMYPGYLELPTEKIIEGTVPFGKTMDAVFAMTKGFVFRDGVESLSPRTQQRIQSLYRQHGLATESRRTDPITSGYEYLELRAKIVAEQMAKRATEARGVFEGLSE